MHIFLNCHWRSNFKYLWTIKRFRSDPFNRSWLAKRSEKRDRSCNYIDQTSDGHEEFVKNFFVHFFFATSSGKYHESLFLFWCTNPFSCTPLLHPVIDLKYIYIWEVRYAERVCLRGMSVSFPHGRIFAISLKKGIGRRPVILSRRKYATIMLFQKKVPGHTMGTSPT